MIYKQKVKAIVNNAKLFKQLDTYVQMLETKNKLMNLTSFKGEQIWRDGIYESLVTFRKVKVEGKMLDIGAGAGFPSVPLVIINPKIDLTIIEANTKRVQFLTEVFKVLELSVKIINDRIENIKNQNFNFITARAVAPLFKLIEISHHLGSQSATYYFIKGPNVQTELFEAKSILKKLQIEDLTLKKTSLDFKTIYVVSYSKKHPTPNKIPRRWSQIKKPKL